MDRNLIRLIKDAVVDGTSSVSAIFARLGAPAGASLAADVAAIKAETALIKGYTDTEMADLLRFVKNERSVYPTLAADVTVTGGAAWVLGAFAEIIPAAAVVADFQVDGVAVSAASAAGKYELVLYHGGADTEFCRIRFTLDATLLVTNLVVTGGKTLAANDKVRAKLASAAGAQTADISLQYHLI